MSYAEDNKMNLSTAAKIITNLFQPIAAAVATHIYIDFDQVISELSVEHSIILIHQPEVAMAFLQQKLSVEMNASPSDVIFFSKYHLKLKGGELHVRVGNDAVVEISSSMFNQRIKKNSLVVSSIAGNQRLKSFIKGETVGFYDVSTFELTNYLQKKLPTSEKAKTISTQNVDQISEALLIEIAASLRRLFKTGQSGETTLHIYAAANALFDLYPEIVEQRSKWRLYGGHRATVFVQKLFPDMVVASCGLYLFKPIQTDVQRRKARLFNQADSIFQLSNNSKKLSSKSIAKAAKLPWIVGYCEKDLAKTIIREKRWLDGYKQKQKAKKKEPEPDLKYLFDNEWNLF